MKKTVRKLFQSPMEFSPESPLSKAIIVTCIRIRVKYFWIWQILQRRSLEFSGHSFFCNTLMICFVLWFPQLGSQWFFVNQLLYWGDCIDRGDRFRRIPTQEIAKCFGYSGSVLDFDIRLLKDHLILGSSVVPSPVVWAKRTAPSYQCRPKRFPHLRDTAEILVPRM